MQFDVKYLLLSAEAVKHEISCIRSKIKLCMRAGVSLAMLGLAAARSIIFKT